MLYIFLKYIRIVCGFLRNRSQFWVFIVIFQLRALKLIRNGYYYLRSIKSVKICCPVLSTRIIFLRVINPLTPNDHYSGRTASLTSKRFILYICSTNIGTEYFKHVIYSPFFFSSKCSLFHNSNVFRSCIINILYTGCAKN